MGFEKFLFYCFAIIVVVAAGMVITRRNPVHAVLYLVLAFVGSAGLWMLLEAEFLAIALVLVYVGAVMVLFLFVVMMLDIDVAAMKAQYIRYLPVGLLIAGVLLIRSSRMARFLNDNIPGVQVSETLVQRLDSAEDPLAEGVEIAREAAAWAHELCQGVHLMTLGHEDKIPEILS